MEQRPDPNKDLRVNQLRAHRLHVYDPCLFKDGTLWVTVPPWEMHKAEQTATKLAYMHKNEIYVFRARRRFHSVS